MFKDNIVHLACIRGRMQLVVMVSALLACLGIASSPALAAKEPTGVFASYKQCPRFTEITELLCQHSLITSGEVTLNKLTVPIVNAITFQGGIAGNGSETEIVIAALNGETFSNTPQEIAGGLSALIDCNEIKGAGLLARARRGTCKATIENPRLPRSFKAAYETTELAEPASDIRINRADAFLRVGAALTLPVRFHLESPLLGPECYIGSSANPVVLNLTTGTTSPPPPNHPISGSPGNLEFVTEETALVLTDVTSVDNSFAAPEATGCGGHLSSFIDPLVNSKIGLPSPAGYNTVIHSGLDEDALAQAVIASEEETTTTKETGHPGEKWSEKRDYGRNPNPWWR